MRHAACEHLLQQHVCGNTISCGMRHASTCCSNRCSARCHDVIPVPSARIPHSLHRVVSGNCRGRRHTRHIAAGADTPDTLPRARA